MKELTKQNVCVFIENEEQLEEAKELLIKYNQKDLIDENHFFLDTDGETEYNFLYFEIVTRDWGLGMSKYKTIITLLELEEILKHESI